MTRSFRITHLLGGSALVALIASATLAVTSAGAQGSAPQIGAYSTRGAWNFVSAPNLHPPRLTSAFRARRARLAGGYFLTANFPNLAAAAVNPSLVLSGQGGPLLLNNRLQPVWFKPAPTDVVTTDLQQERLDGRPVLSWWQGVVDNTGASTSGTVYVVNQHYRQVAKLTGDTANGWVISVHDFQISGHNAWVTVYKYLPGQNFSAYGGTTNGTLYDSAVQEYDLRSGKLLYTWDAFNPGHAPNIPLTQSYAPAPKGPQPAWDAYHVNAVQLVGNSEFLVSMRNTGAAYLVNYKTGRIVWTLGGKPGVSSFTLPDVGRFYFQHNVALHPGNIVTLFDNHCCAIIGKGKFAAPPGGGHSRGLVLRLNLASHTASVVAQYGHTPPLDVAFTGSMQQLPGGNTLVGWGSRPYFSEYSKSGRLLLDALWPGIDINYRTLFTPRWVGTPYYAPRGGFRPAHGRVTVYASWNGATEVARWQVLGGRDARHLKVVASHPFGGFETAIPLGRRSFREYRVRALNRRGRTLGTSGLFPTPQSPNASIPQGY